MKNLKDILTEAQGFGTNGWEYVENHYERVNLPAFGIDYNDEPVRIHTLKKWPFKQGEHEHFVMDILREVDGGRNETEYPGNWEDDDLIQKGDWVAYCTDYDGNIYTYIVGSEGVSIINI